MSTNRARCSIVLAIVASVLLLLPTVALAMVHDEITPVIPGIEFELPFNSLCSLAADDATNVISFELTKGEKLMAVMATPVNTHFEMRLYPPDTPDGDPPVWYLAKSNAVDGDVTHQFLSYKVEDTGTYYLATYLMPDSASGGRYLTVIAETHPNRLSTPTVPETVKPYRRFKITTFTNPLYIFESNPVKIYVEKRVHGKTVKKMSEWAYHEPEFGRTRYWVWASLSKGTWRTRASFSDYTTPRYYTAWKTFKVD